MFAAMDRELRTLECQTQLKTPLSVQKQWGMEVTRPEFAAHGREHGRLRCGKIVHNQRSIMLNFFLYCVGVMLLKAFCEIAAVYHIDADCDFFNGEVLRLQQDFSLTKTRLLPELPWRLFEYAFEFREE